MDKGAHSNLKPRHLKMIQAYVGSLREEGYPIEKVIVFGSYVRGNPKPWSDIDLCVVSPRFGLNSIKEMTELNLKTLRTRPRIEVHPYSPEDFEFLPDPLLDEIKATGMEIEPR